MPLNQQQAESLAKETAEAIFDKWQADGGITKASLEKLLIEQLTRRRPGDDTPPSATVPWTYHGVVPLNGHLSSIIYSDDVGDRGIEYFMQPKATNYIKTSG